MNFLGHCLLTQYNTEYISGNLGGDHFKGDLENFTEIPSSIITGVRIHRFIDSFTDNSPHVKAVALLFREHGVRRVSFIASDILLDHYISKNWAKYSNSQLDEFIKSIYTLTEKDLIHFPEEFHYIFHHMSKHDWLSNYIRPEGISETLRNFEYRIPFSNNLHDAFQVYVDNTVKIDQLYQQFMEDIINAVNAKFNLKLS